MKICNKCGRVYEDCAIVCAPLLNFCNGSLVQVEPPALLPEEKQTGELRYPLAERFQHLSTEVSE